MDSTTQPVIFQAFEGSLTPSMATPMLLLTVPHLAPFTLPL